MTEKLIEDYLINHEVARNLEEHHIQMLRSVFMSFAVQHNEDHFYNISALFAYCNQELTSYEWPEPAIARIANRALELYFERSQNSVSVEEA